MTRGGNVRVKFDADTKDLDRGTRDAEKSLGRLDKAGGLSGRGIGAGAAIAATGFTALAVGAKSAVAAYTESLQVSKQTAAVIKSTGGAAGITAKHVADLATAISNKTGIDDEAIQSGENLLLTFTNVRNEAGRGNDVFNRATQTIQDMSVALGQDTKSSAIQLGKALNDPIKGITALSRVGVSFTEQQKKQITTLTESGHRLDAQKIILRELGKEFGGSAQAAATSTGKLKVQIGNIQEAIGGALYPAIQKAATGISQAISALPAVFTRLKATISAFVARNREDINSFVHAIQNVATAVRVVFEDVVLPVIRRVLPAVKQVFDGMVQAIRGAVRVITGVLTGDFGKAWDGVKDIFRGGLKAAWGVIRAETAGARAAASAVGNAIKSTFDSIWAKIVGAARSTVNAIIGAYNAIPLAPNIKKIQAPRKAAPAAPRGILGAGTGVGGPSADASALKRFGYRTTPGVTQIGEDWEFKPWDTPYLGGGPETTTDTTAKDAMLALVAEMAAMRATIEANTQIQSTVQAVGLRSAMRSLADVMSGEIAGRGLAPRAATAGSGIGARY